MVKASPSGCVRPLRPVRLGELGLEEALGEVRGATGVMAGETHTWWQTPPSQTGKDFISEKSRVQGWGTFLQAATHGGAVLRRLGAPAPGL